MIATVTAYFNPGECRNVLKPSRRQIKSAIANQLPCDIELGYIGDLDLSDIADDFDEFIYDYGIDEFISECTIYMDTYEYQGIIEDGMDEFTVEVDIPTPDDLI